MQNGVCSLCIKEKETIRKSSLWRSRRDLNPRAAYGDNTISNRARYDHFDTTPYMSLFRTALTIIPEKSCLSRKNAKFVVEIYPAHICGAEQ